MKLEKIKNVEPKIHVIFHVVLDSEMKTKNIVNKFNAYYEM